MMKIVQLDGIRQEELQRLSEMRRTTAFPEQEQTVRQILSRVMEEGDEALFAYAKEWDGVELTPDNIVVTKEDIREAYVRCDDALIAVMRRSAENIRRFHEKQLRNGFLDTGSDGILLGQKITPMDIAGVYVPGGKAAYPSSVLMNIIPAKVAGVGKVIMTTPASAEESASKVAGIDKATLVAADLAGADTIYRVGGAQAIAAMAYGTQSVPKVDKITGPGNIYVALAKKAVFGHVSIDSVAGPSEVTILADETADPRFVAADLLAQAEHDERACAVLVTTSMELAMEVQKITEEMTRTLPRRDIIRASLEQFGTVFVSDTLDEAVDAVNRIAPEHLEIMTKDPHLLLPKIKHAGAVFLGAWSPEPLGDYFAGPNHILPTNGTARFFSPLSVDDFIKKTSVIAYSREALYHVREDIMRFADEEGLGAHAASVRVRFES